MITLDLSILNQKGTPMFNSDTLANRPAAGIVGRIFIAIDAPYGIYRDTGSAWDQISGASTFSGSLATGQVAFGSATNTISGTNNLFWDNANGRLGIGTNTPANPLHILQNLNGSNYARISNISSGSQALAGFYITNNLNVGAAIYITSSNFTGGLANTAVFTTDGSISGGLLFQTGNASASIRFASGLGTDQMRLFATGNLVLQNGGTFTDGGQRLQVYGDAFVRGSADTFGTSGLTIQNSSSLNLFRVLNNGMLRLGNTSSSPILFPHATEGGSANLSGTNFAFYSYTSSQAATLGRFYFSGDNMVQTTGANFNIYSLATFLPTSGTATYANIFIGATINQMGGANGITRGLYVNPTLTAAADWRSIEWSNNSGWGLYGAGTALNYLGGTLGIKTTSPYAPSTFSLDVNGGLLVKNTAGTTAQITLINADPSLGGNNGFLVASVGGTSGGSYVDFQGYYGTSVVGSTALRLNPAGGAVIVNSNTNTGEQFQLTGTIRVNGQTSGSAGGNSGQHLIINCDGTSYKIALLNP